MRRLLSPRALCCEAVLLTVGATFLAGQQHDMNAGAKSPELLETTGPKETMGAWSPVPLAALADRMQSIHTTLMPNGKVLMVSGSSYRLTIANGQPVEGIVETDYDSVNNSQIFDPATNSFHRIPSPPAEVSGLPNDLFCAGHMATPDGKILFVGGQSKNGGPTQAERGKFYGGEFANLYDWKTGTWEKPFRLPSGHWYPTVVELGSGLIAAFSGFMTDNQPNHQAVNSSVVEFYDSGKPFAKAWTSVDIRDLPNSPFTTFKSSSSSTPSDGDQMDHYPRIFLMRDGRLFLTGDGSGGGYANGRNTYFMTVTPGKGAEAPAVQFALGAPRLVSRRTYGTGFVDPNSEDGDIILTGGMLANAPFVSGPSAPVPGPNPDAVTATAERYRPPSAHMPGDVGSWEVYPRFMGDRPDDVRTMHVATVLPNKQVLISGGGNYPQHNPVLTPILLTRDSTQPGGYAVKRLNQASQPRLYHSVALLLPDGRVLVSGGNASRAARDPKDGSIHLNVYRHTEDPTTYSWVEKGDYAIPGEIYRSEIYSPPYLFGPSARPKITVAGKDLKYGARVTARVENPAADASVVLMKLGAVTHGWDFGQHLEDLKFTQDLASRQISIALPTNRNACPPGYYMLFYVNGQGKPSVAEIIKLS